MELDQKEKQSIRTLITSLVSPNPTDMSTALKEAREQDMNYTEYFQAQREYTLDFSSKFSYDTITDAIKQMKKAFNVTLWMHRITFYTGIFLIFVAVYAAFLGQNLLAGSLGLGSVADISYHFYKKPLEGVHRSIGNLVQLEAAFLGFINELGYWKSFQAGPNAEENAKVASALRELTEKTMELIEKYVETELSPQGKS